MGTLLHAFALLSRRRYHLDHRAHAEMGGWGEKVLVTGFTSTGCGSLAIKLMKNLL